MAACLWMLDSPEQGVCVPDDLPHDFVLEVSKPYLGRIVSVASDWNPLKHYANVFHGFNRPAGSVRPVAVQELSDRRVTDGRKTLLRLTKAHGTPLVVVDHKALRENYGQFRKVLPRVRSTTPSRPTALRRSYEPSTRQARASMSPAWPSF